jgi:hypothetical protein
MTRYKILILTFASFLIVQHTFSQRSKKVERAIKTYEAGEYKEAVDLLKEAYDFESDKEKRTRSSSNSATAPGA